MRATSRTHVAIILIKSLALSVGIRSEEGKLENANLELAFNRADIRDDGCSTDLQKEPAAQKLQQAEEIATRIEHELFGKLSRDESTTRAACNHLLVTLVQQAKKNKHAGAMQALSIAISALTFAAAGAEVALDHLKVKGVPAGEIPALLNVVNFWANVAEEVEEGEEVIEGAQEMRERSRSEDQGGNRTRSGAARKAIKESYEASVKDAEGNLRTAGHGLTTSCLLIAAALAADTVTWGASTTAVSGMLSGGQAYVQSQLQEIGEVHSMALVVLFQKLDCARILVMEARGAKRTEITDLMASLGIAMQS